MLLEKYTITPFKDLYWKIKVQQSRNMLGMQSTIPRVKKECSEVRMFAVKLSDL